MHPFAVSLLLFCGLAATACNTGLEPPPPPPFGTIEANVTYTGDWPEEASLFDLRFVAFRFVPQDTTDFFRLNEYIFSETLSYNVASDQVTVEEVEEGTFVYTGIAQKFGAGVVDWRPVGIFEDNFGVFDLRAGERVTLNIEVDFDDLPPFPPPQ